ncbi:MAG: hypothetical protein P4L84_05145 [Isosphaeraceae bacterium]|nr:hypothetical protein [Isosphaeraceae bacterium]
MRREVEARARETSATFARLKAIPVPAPVPQPQLQVFARPQPAFPAARPVVIEEVEWATDADDDEPAQPVVVYTDQAFDLYAFGRADGALAWQLRLATQLEQEVERVAVERQLTPAQKEKLRLAGKGDIKRHVDWIDAKRKQFETVRRDRLKGRELLIELRTVAGSRFQPWMESSFYDKVLKKIEQDCKAADDDPEAYKPLPGSKLDLRKAMEQANVIVLASDLKLQSQSGIPSFSIWCATATVTRSLRGTVANGPLSLSSIPVSPPESLPPRGGSTEYLLFIDRSEGNGISLHRVIKMLRSTDENRRFVGELLNR